MDTIFTKFNFTVSSLYISIIKTLIFCFTVALNYCPILFPLMESIMPRNSN